MIVVERLNNIDHVSFANLEKLDAPEVDEIKSQLVRLFDLPNSKVVIDLKGVKYIDSMGFGCFLTTMKAARNNYGTLKICNIDTDLMALFRGLHLDTILDLYKDFDSCINSF